MPYLGAQGSYVGMTRTIAASSPRQQEAAMAFPQAYPQQMAQLVAQAGLQNTAEVKAINTIAVPPELAGPLARLLVFRMMHNTRSEERLVGHECDRTLRSRGSPCCSKKKTK